MARPKKTLVEKAKDVVDHVLHPDQSAEISGERSGEALPPISETDMHGPIEGHPPIKDSEKMEEFEKPEITRSRIGVESSSQNSELAKHPKFAKFKSQGENQ